MVNICEICVIYSGDNGESAARQIIVDSGHFPASYEFKYLQYEPRTFCMTFDAILSANVLIVVITRAERSKTDIDADTSQKYENILKWAYLNKYMRLVLFVHDGKVEERDRYFQMLRDRMLERMVFKHVDFIEPATIPTRLAKVYRFGQISFTIEKAEPVRLNWKLHELNGKWKRNMEILKCAHHGLLYENTMPVHVATSDCMYYDATKSSLTLARLIQLKVSEVTSTSLQPNDHGFLVNYWVSDRPFRVVSVTRTTSLVELSIELKTGAMIETNTSFPQKSYVYLFDTAKNLIAMGVCVHAQNLHDSDPVMFTRSQINMMRQLVITNQPEVLRKFMLENRISKQNDVLHLAIKQDRLDIVKMLLESRLVDLYWLDNPWKRLAIDYARKSNHLFEYLVADKTRFGINSTEWTAFMSMMKTFPNWAGHIHSLFKKYPNEKNFSSVTIELVLIVSKIQDFSRNSTDFWLHLKSLAPKTITVADCITYILDLGCRDRILYVPGFGKSPTSSAILDYELLKIAVEHDDDELFEIGLKMLFLLNYGRETERFNMMSLRALNISIFEQLVNLNCASITRAFLKTPGFRKHWFVFVGDLFTERKLLLFQLMKHFDFEFKLNHFVWTTAVTRRPAPFVTLDALMHGLSFVLCTEAMECRSADAELRDLFHYPLVNNVLTFHVVAIDVLLYHDKIEKRLAQELNHGPNRTHEYTFLTLQQWFIDTPGFYDVGVLIDFLNKIKRLWNAKVADTDDDHAVRLFDLFMCNEPLRLFKFCEQLDSLLAITRMESLVKQFLMIRLAQVRAAHEIFRTLLYRFPIDYCEKVVSMLGPDDLTTAYLKTDQSFSSEFYLQ